MKHSTTELLILFIFVSFLFSGCEKEFLNAKPNQSLIIPSTLDDYGLLINDNFVFNFGQDCPLSTVSADEYYITTDIFNSLDNTQRNIYTWSATIDVGDGLDKNYWNFPYQQVYYANTVLEGIKNIKPNNIDHTEFNRIKGSALFYRAWAFFGLLTAYSLPYNGQTSSTDLGIPLRLSTDFNIKYDRAPIKDCYEQIINDLKIAVDLLPEKNPIKTQPSQLAALGLLSRVYLSMADYSNAEKCADSYLKIDEELTDYNTLVATTTNSTISSQIVSEVCYLTGQQNIISRSEALIDSGFVATYDDNDLRKTLFFLKSENGIHFKGSYDTWGNFFSGIATDEIYLTLAECYARDGNAAKATDLLNRLLKSRWNNNAPYIPLQVQNATDALSLVLKERKKELLFRGTRWIDLRRLNQEDQFKVTLSRNINNTTYKLPPNDPRYALPIPNSEIQLNNLKQNPR